MLGARWLQQYNETYNTVISIDLKGVIEYWSAETYEFPATDIQFKYKLDTDLYEFAKVRMQGDECPHLWSIHDYEPGCLCFAKQTSVLPTSLSISPNGKLFAAMVRSLHHESEQSHLMFAFCNEQF